MRSKSQATLHMLFVSHLAVRSRTVVCSRLRYLCTMSRPRCYFDITADGKAIGRVVMEVSLGNKLLCMPLQFLAEVVVSIAIRY